MPETLEFCGVHYVNLGGATYTNKEGEVKSVIRWRGACKFRHDDGTTCGKEFETLSTSWPRVRTCETHRGLLTMHTSRKLSFRQAVQARLDYAAGGWSQKALAEAFGVSEALMHELLSRKTYCKAEKHAASAKLTGRPGPGKSKGGGSPPRTFTDDDVLTIRRRVQAGERPAAIAKHFGWDAGSVRNIALGRRRADVADPIADLL